MTQKTTTMHLLLFLNAQSNGFTNMPGQFDPSNINAPSMWLRDLAKAPVNSSTPLTEQESAAIRLEMAEHYQRSSREREQIRNNRLTQGGSSLLDWSGVVEFPMELGAYFGEAAGIGGAALRRLPVVWAGVQFSETVAVQAYKHFDNQTLALLDQANARSAETYLNSICRLGNPSGDPECRSLGNGANTLSSLLDAQSLANREIARLTKKSSRHIIDNHGDDPAQLAAKMELFESLLKAFDSEQSVGFSELSDSLKTVEGSLQVLARLALDSNRDQGDVSRVQFDRDFLKELLHGEQTPSRALEGLRENLIKESALTEEQKTAQAEFMRFSQKSREVLVGGNTVIAFAQHLKNAGLGINQDDIDKAQEVMGFADTMLNAGLSIVTSGGSPIGYLAAANIVMSSFMTRSGSANDSQNAAILAEIRSMRAEIVSSRIQLGGNIDQLREQVFAKFSQIQVIQEFTLNQITGLSRQIDGLGQSLSEVHKAISTLAKHQDELERKLFEQLDIINIRLWQLGTAVNATQSALLNGLEDFREQCRKTWPSGRPTSLESAQHFFAAPGNRNCDFWKKTHDALALVLGGDDDDLSHPLFSMDHLTPFSLMSDRRISDDYVFKVAQPVFRLFAQCYERDKTIDGMIYAQMFSPSWYVNEITTKTPVFGCPAIQKSLISFQKVVEKVVHSDFLIRLARDLIVFLPWYELIKDRMNPGILFTREELNGPTRKGLLEISFKYLFKVKRLLDIAVFQQTLLDGDAFLPEMVNIVFQAKGHEDIANLNREFSILEAQIDAPNIEISRQQRYREEELAKVDQLLKTQNPASYDEAIAKINEALEKLVAEFRAKRVGVRIDNSDIEKEITAISNGTLPPTISANSSEAALCENMMALYHKSNVLKIERSHADQMLSIGRAGLRITEAAISQLQALKDDSLDKRNRLNSVIERLKAQVPAGPSRLEAFGLLKMAISRNIRLQKNLALYFVSYCLKRSGKVKASYRAAFSRDNASVLASVLGLDIGIFPLSLDSSAPNQSHQWRVSLGSDDAGKEVLLTLPTPDALSHGLLQHSETLCELLEVRRAIVNELNSIIVSEEAFAADGHLRA